MNKQCEIVQDLLPLYVDGACSNASAEMIREHLSTCPGCSELYKQMRSHTNEDILTNERTGVLARHGRSVKKKRVLTIAVSVLVTFALLSALYLFVPGFTKLGNVYIADYSVSEDGSEMTIRVGVAASIGYVREVAVYQQHGGKLYLDCYSAFGGINGSWGARTEFTVPLEADTEMIAIYRSPNCYETVLEKDEHGEWVLTRLLYGDMLDPNAVDRDQVVCGEGQGLEP